MGARLIVFHALCSCVDYEERKQAKFHFCEVAAFRQDFLTK